MTTITIPQKITKGEELVVISRKEYENFLHSVSQDKTPVLSYGLIEALEEIRQGKVMGPFKTAKSLMQSLKQKK